MYVKKYTFLGNSLTDLLQVMFLPVILRYGEGPPL